MRGRSEPYSLLPSNKIIANWSTYDVKIGRSEHLTSDGIDVLPLLLNFSHLARFEFS